MLNKDNETMTNPYKWAALTLSMIRGPLVNDWAYKQIDHLHNQFHTNNVPMQDDVHWAEFETAFINRFTDLHKVTKATTALQNLKMRIGDLDAYVSQFRSLAHKAGYDLDAPSTLQTFLKGLSPLLRQRVIWQHPNADNFNKYLKAAQAKSKAIERENLIFREGKWLKPNWIKPSPPHNPRPNLRPNPYQQCPHNPPRYPYINGTPMDVDTLQKAETTEDKKKHRDEGCCFECNKQGHMAWDCPTKKFNLRKPQKPSYIKMVQDQEYDDEELKEYKEEEEEELQEQDEIDELVNWMVSFSDDKKVQWMNAM